MNFLTVFFDENLKTGEFLTVFSREILNDGGILKLFNGASDGNLTLLSGEILSSDEILTVYSGDDVIISGGGTRTRIFIPQFTNRSKLSFISMQIMVRNGTMVSKTNIHRKLLRSKP